MRLSIDFSSHSPLGYRTIILSCAQTRYTGPGGKQVGRAGSVGVSTLRTQATPALKRNFISLLLDQEVQNCETGVRVGVLLDPFPPAE